MNQDQSASRSDAEALLAEARRELQVIASYHDDENINIGLRLTANAYRKLIDKIDDHMRAPRSELQDRKPVAWRYRYGPKGMWKYADDKADCNPSPNYEQQPLFTLTDERNSS
jgi:hypothetical protein